MANKANIIDASYFFGVLSLGINNFYIAPNEGSTTTAADHSELSAFIRAFEWEYLCKMFGTPLAEAIVKYVRRGEEEESESRMETLLAALRNAAGVSPVACYVFFRILETRNARVTETGVVLGAGVKSSIASPQPHQLQAWNIMADLNKQLSALALDTFADYAPRTQPTMCQHLNSLGL